MDEPSRQVSSRHKREKKNRKDLFIQTENSKLQATKKSEHGKQQAINHGFFFADDG
jgi:hypothetical protein